MSVFGSVSKGMPSRRLTPYKSTLQAEQPPRHVNGESRSWRGQSASLRLPNTYSAKTRPADEVWQSLHLAQERVNKWLRVKIGGERR